MDFRESDQFYSEMLAMQQDLRMIFGATIAWPFICIGLALLGQIPPITAILGCVCASVAMAILVFRNRDRSDWWFLWRGPLLRLAVTDEQQYGEKVIWLLENYGTDIKVLGTGVIKFKHARLAVLFKMM
jgi:hypothetical protein